MSLNPIELLPYPAALTLLALLAYIALRLVDDGETPVWPKRPSDPSRHALRTATVKIQADLPDEEPEEETMPITDAMALLDEAEPEIEYDPLDMRIPLEEVERRMALAAAEEDIRELVAA